MGNMILHFLLMWKEDELEFIPVGQEELVLITPKDHPLAQKEEIDLLDTIEYDYVYFTKNSGLRPVIDSCFSRIKRQPTIAYEGEEDSSVAGLVAAGFGIAIVPKIPLLIQWMCSSDHITRDRTIYISCTKKEKYLTPVVKDFISFITDQSEFA